VRVAACPGWSAHDVVAHVTGVVDDVLSGRLDGVASEPWTAAQVEARRAQSIDDMLADWGAKAPAFERFLDDVGDPGRQAVADLVTHEHDLRGALGRPGFRDSDAVAIAYEFIARGFVNTARARGLRVKVGAMGDDDAPLVLSGDPFTLLRAMTGRRDVQQLRSLHWQGDPEVALAAFTWGPFQPSPHAIDE
jgi:uncharacterized protein (TIGR03083 family)